MQLFLKKCQCQSTQKPPTFPFIFGKYRDFFVAMERKMKTGFPVYYAVCLFGSILDR
jgi:hypothetical protein